RDAPDRVEEAPEEERAEEVPDGEHDDVDRHERGRDAVERAEQVAQVERDAVVEERLADEEREAQERALRVELERRVRDRPERDHLPLPDLDLVVHLLEPLPRLALDGLLDVADDLLGLLLAAVDEEPAGALRHVAPNDHDRQAEERTEPERDSP